jgi:SAM-dependent methyltransferase
VGNISQHVRTWGHLDPVRQWIRCGSCETLYVEAPPSAAALERWSVASAPPVASTAPDLTAFSEQLDQVQSELDTIERLGFGMAWVDQAEAPIPRLLEVGCGWGSFLAAAEWRGFRPTGVTSPPQADWISNTLAVPCMDNDTRTGLVPEDLPTGEFDIVILRDGIDRAPDPVAVLETASHRMAPDGLMVLQVALHDHPIHRLQGYDATHWSSPDRRAFFTRRTLELTLARAGLRTEEVRHPEGAPAGVALVFVRRDDMHDLFRTE